MARSDFHLRNDLAEIDRFNSMLDTFATSASVPMVVIERLQVVADEILTNIIRYAFPDGQSHAIGVHLDKVGDYVTLGFDDDGAAFNPLEHPEPDLDAPLDEWPSGGLGIHLVKSLTDHVVYARLDDRNWFEVKIRCDREGTGNGAA